MNNVFDEDWREQYWRDKIERIIKISNKFFPKNNLDKEFWEHQPCIVITLIDEIYKKFLKENKRKKEVKMKTKFIIGDRVKREIDIFKVDSEFKYGKIIKVYSEPIKKYRGGLVLGPYPELYEVLWDSGQTEKGFLPHGLDFE